MSEDIEYRNHLMATGKHPRFSKVDVTSQRRNLNQGIYSGAEAVEASAVLIQSMKKDPLPIARFAAQALAVIDQPDVLLSAVMAFIKHSHLAHPALDQLREAIQSTSDPKRRALMTQALGEALEQAPEIDFTLLARAYHTIHSEKMDPVQAEKRLLDALTEDDSTAVQRAAQKALAQISIRTGEWRQEHQTLVTQARQKFQSAAAENLQRAQRNLSALTSSNARIANRAESDLKKMIQDQAPLEEAVFHSGSDREIQSMVLFQLQALQPVLRFMELKLKELQGRTPRAQGLADLLAQVLLPF